ncbi:MAG: 1,3-beta-galactosyl-N-acetylhexosamine phosphorylase N-terminal domain-containing protein, partial [Kiritimatiellia bacterium]|nr:1,3-beta-galactosyl-N-acetylhexosamine phosphorylase N-terminal domain-containing protein [Kiritimatiellia bacterium]
MKEKRKGLTLPAESGQEKVVRKLAEKWGADALRDSDGTVLSDEIINMEYDIYSTVCIVRAEQDYARKVKEKMIEGLPGKFLMSNPVTAVSDKVEINLMELYFNEKYIINKKSDPEKYWEVIDRTTNNVVDVSGWEFNPDTEKVIIKNAKKFHAYTVNFLVYQI